METQSEIQEEIEMRCSIYTQRTVAELLPNPVKDEYFRWSYIKTYKSSMSTALSVKFNRLILQASPLNYLFTILTWSFKLMSLSQTNLN